MVKLIENMEELEKVFREAAGKAVFIDFYATWCGPCKMIAPKLEEWSGTYTNVVFLKVDVDKSEDIAMKYGIEAMPTFKLFKDSKVVDEVCGANAAKVEAMIKKYN